MEDSKETSMVNKKDQAAAFSWWWDSHNRPHHSQWLEATLSGSYLFQYSDLGFRALGHSMLILAFVWLILSHCTYTFMFFFLVKNRITILNSSFCLFSLFCFFHAWICPRVSHTLRIWLFLNNLQYWERKIQTWDRTWSVMINALNKPGTTIPDSDYLIFMI